MTVIVGFNCPDGLVLCSDSLVSDGYTKSLVNKIWAYETQGQWGMAVGQAGESDFCDSFVENLKVLYSGYVFDEDKIMLTLRTAIRAARITYPDLEWAALFAIWGPMGTRKLLRLSHQSKHLAPVRRYEAVGIGSHLAKFLCSQMCGVLMQVEEAAELGTFIVGRCIEHVSDCEGPISVLTWKVGQDEWAPYTPERVGQIEKGFGENSRLRRNLMEFWQSLTPHLSRIAPQYVDINRGGRVGFIRAMPTKEWPTQSTSRKSKREP